MHVIKQSVWKTGVIDRQSFWKTKKMLASKSKESFHSLTDKQENLLTYPSAIEYRNKFQHRLRKNGNEF